MDQFSERRMVENELMFRSANRQVQKQVQKDYHDRTVPDSTKLQFYCECSNLYCRDRIRLTTDEYQTAAIGNKEFVIIPGHENNAIETVVNESDVYYVVEKHMDPARVTRKSLS